MITAKVICDSISPEGIRLTTLHLRYPRMVHADFMTHRVFSRNGRSSRAVPFATLVKETPYIPDFHYNQKGMTAGERLSKEDMKTANLLWEAAALYCQKVALSLSEIGGVGVHKQWVNRMLEWFGWIDVLVTSTDWANFFELRDEDGAQPEIIELAKAMKVAIDGSKPNMLEPGQWHLPYIDMETILEVREIAEKQNPKWQLKYGAESTNAKMQADYLDLIRKVSVARCARLTIRPFDGDGSIEKELARYDRLMVSRPVHSSPSEHIATPDYKVFQEGMPERWANQKDHRNFFGWRQFRAMIPYETVYDR